MLKVIGVGDNFVDRYLHQQMMYPGGNSVNFAVYAKQLGYEAAYMGPVADDRYAALVMETLDKMGIDRSMCQHVHGETGTGSITFVDGDRIITDDNDWGVTKTSPLRLSAERLDYIEQFDVVHTAVYGCIADQLYLIKERDVPIVYDFSDKWEEADFDAVCPHISIAFFSGKKLPDDELKRLLQKAAALGCGMAITTIGERGAIVYNGNEFFVSHPYMQGREVLDTIGAGDSFLTGFVTTYMEGLLQYKRCVGSDEEHYTLQADRQSFSNALTGHAIQMGSLMARKGCMSYGAFGHGVAL